jgi:DNA helicase-2/ATP-dependent DNA helicase PcrA
MDFLKGLNPQQREAVSCTEGPLLILAGAGSGKTRVITHRIAHMVASKHVPPSAILAVTFTNKASGEMRERVASLLGDIPLDSSPLISTFHSFCVRLLRRDGEPLARIRPGFTRRFSIYDDDDQIAIIKAAYRALGLDEKEFMQYRSATPRTPANRLPIFIRAPSTRKAKPWPRSTRSTRRPCGTLTPWISTTCCSKPCGCCSTTKPPARCGTGG